MPTTPDEIRFFEWVLHTMRAAKVALGLKAVYEQTLIETKRMDFPCLNIVWNSYGDESLDTGDEFKILVSLNFTMELRLRDLSTPERTLLKQVAEIRNHLRSSIYSGWTGDILPGTFVFGAVSKVEPDETNVELGANIPFSIMMKSSLETGL